MTVYPRLRPNPGRTRRLTSVVMRSSSRPQPNSSQTSHPAAVHSTRASERPVRKPSSGIWGARSGGVARCAGLYALLSMRMSSYVGRDRLLLGVDAVEDRAIGEKFRVGIVPILCRRSDGEEREGGKIRRVTL